MDFGADSHTQSSSLLNKLRAIDVTQRITADNNPWEAAILAEFARSGVAFTASSPAMESRFYDAVTELIACIKPTGSEQPILHEGGIYHGCWLESTGTINAELLSRFVPSIAAATFAVFAEHQREDGLLPYKLTPNGPVFSQIQLVSPLARSVWTHYSLNGRDKAYLAKMYRSMAAYDAWLAEWRDTRKTGAVEAFCAFDTGHDLSARFWHVPDSPFNNDTKAYNPDNPVLPFIAPDLTANVACQRLYLARMAEELGEDPAPWRARAEQSIGALFEQCFHAEDGFFYDRDRNSQHVRVQSDVLLRVLACEVGDDAFFAEALSRYLLNTRKFFAKYPLTSIALDDPRFDPAYDYNSWCGPTNFLTLIRTPHAFEHHHRHVELTWILYPTLSAQFRSTRFAQTLHPFTGREGFTEAYSPSILCLLDFVERLSGIQPRPDGALWFTGLVPYQIEHRDVAHETAYARTVDGHHFELVNTRTHSTAYRDGEVLFRAPKGVRIITDRTGTIAGLIGISVNTITGTLHTSDGAIDFTAAANEQLHLENGAFTRLHNPGLVHPTY
ncbi:hypothetical protein N8A98_21175 [Devosia neptuniae]|uniref:Mannosylglycerate hydrolase MGH1-like glycoside hydrolase domain-containing protein n=1 Tax=Devosia neptuniae TaxID=191302 RepID=A0ABY6CBR7_9HYPH|nr:hypothetical protein [Devosia neptuniae]UXN69695.1 hypothetical protein N8A98_21175 [Devosia neptuniae]